MQSDDACGPVLRIALHHLAALHDPEEASFLVAEAAAAFKVVAAFRGQGDGALQGQDVRPVVRVQGIDPRTDVIGQLLLAGIAQHGPVMLIEEKGIRLRVPVPEAVFGSEGEGQGPLIRQGKEGAFLLGREEGGLPVGRGDAMQAAADHDGPVLLVAQQHRAERHEHAALTRPAADKKGVPQAVAHIRVVQDIVKAGVLAYGAEHVADLATQDAGPFRRQAQQMAAGRVKMDKIPVAVVKPEPASIRYAVAGRGAADHKVESPTAVSASG